MIGCYPFFNSDPFILPFSPRIYVVGNQPKFRTEVVQGWAERGEVQKTRILLLSKFSQTGELVLVHTGSLEVKKLSFGLGKSWSTVA